MHSESTLKSYMMMVLVVLLDFDNLKFSTTEFSSNADLDSTEAIWVCVESLDEAKRERKRQRD